MQMLSVFRMSIHVITAFDLVHVIYWGTCSTGLGPFTLKESTNNSKNPSTGRQ